MDNLILSYLVFTIVTLIVAIVISHVFLSDSRFDFLSIFRKKPLPFLKLPPEVRVQIYKNIIDRDPVYPSKQTASTSLISKIKELRKNRRRPIGANLILLANRQINDEYISVLCKTATFTLTLEEGTYLSKSKPRIWDLLPAAYAQIKRCNLRIVADPSILGSHHLMEEGAVGLASRIIAVLRLMSQLECLTVNIHALTNPLPLWFHASQALKVCEGLPLKRINLSSDIKMMRENHLALCYDKGGGASGRNWEWRCPEGHRVYDGLVGKQPIRGFCAALYMECIICDGLLDSISDNSWDTVVWSLKIEISRPYYPFKDANRFLLWISVWMMAHTCWLRHKILKGLLSLRNPNGLNKSQHRLLYSHVFQTNAHFRTQLWKRYFFHRPPL